MNPSPQTFVLSLLLLAACLATGCNRDRASFLDAPTIERLSGLPYPDEADYGPDLDIVVTKNRLNLLLANRTPSSYANIEIWLNRQYVWEVEKIRIGSGNRYPLTNFINEHREPFPTPAGLRPDKGAPVVLAELYDPATELRHRLLVQTIDDRPVGIEGQD